MDTEGLKEKIKGITAPRRPWGKLRHNLEDIPVIGLAVLVRDGEDFEDAGLPDGRVRTGAGAGIKKVSGTAERDTWRGHVFPGV
jgi:hypothetical protein